MPRITEIEKLLFPVKLNPLYTNMTINGVERKIRVPNNKIVVNERTGSPLGVVSNNYKLISNERAIEIGKRCCAELFGANEANSIEVFNVDAPSTASYCHIDLVHKGFVMNLWDEESQSETYVPYVRVTNSYNTSRALRFDIGFCRKICLNGMIFESETIRFSFSHLKHEFDKDVSFILEDNKIQKLFDQFQAKVTLLREVEISSGESMAIIYALFNIKDEENIDFDKKTECAATYHELKDLLLDKLHSYFNQLGDNGYALFNTLTDIASHPINNRYFRRDMNSMQRTAGNWVNMFSRECQKEDFSLPDYIRQLEAITEPASQHPHEAAEA